VQGKGTFVAAPKLGERFVQQTGSIYDEMESRGLRLETIVLRQDSIPCPASVAAKLKIEPNASTCVIVRLRSIQGEKLLVSTTYVPEELCPGLARLDLTNVSLYREFKRRYGLEVAEGDRSMEAVAAGSWEARRLDVPLASPLMRLSGVMCLADGRPVEYSEVLQRGDRTRIDVSVKIESTKSQVSPQLR
jgi:GntR family transcriptional regulator